MSNLSHRLTTLFDDGSNAYYRHNGIGSAEAYDNKKEADVQHTIATIEADLKGLAGDMPHASDCSALAGMDCDCYRGRYIAAIEHYTRDKV